MVNVLHFTTKMFKISVTVTDFVLSFYYLSSQKGIHKDQNVKHFIKKHLLCMRLENYISVITFQTLTRFIQLHRTSKIHRQRVEHI